MRTPLQIDPLLSGALALDGFLEFTVPATLSEPDVRMQHEGGFGLFVGRYGQPARSATAIYDLASLTC